jgi:NAD(P)-dependent dehydrogenase (short-subunit alcohol dehydrogenase family)
MSKVAIITAASKGMGAAIARKFKADGYELVLMSSSEQIVPIATELEAKYVQGSVTDLSDLKKLVELAQTSYGRVDIVVNNTGHPPKGDLLEISDEDWQQGLEIVLLNVTRMAQLVVPIMQEAGQGSIINISTYFAYEPSVAYPVSSAMRAALGSYCKMFADRYGEENIRMNNVLPGFIDSYPVDGATVAKIPLKRAGTVEEIASTVAFLASEEAGYITGQNIKVDGGLGRSV